MVTQTSATAAQVLAAELINRGLARQRALALSAAVIAAYPWARRIGVSRVAKKLVEEGLEPSTAEDFAQTLLAVELLDQRATLTDVIAALRKSKLDSNQTLAIALEGARIHRELRPRIHERPSAPSAVVGFVLDLLGILALLAPIALILFALR